MVSDSGNSTIQITAKPEAAKSFPNRTCPNWSCFYQELQESADLFLN